MQLKVTGLQIVDSKTSLECLLGASNSFANILDVMYTDTTLATIIILLPSMLPGIINGIIGPKSNTQNRVPFKLNVLSSVPFDVDPFSVSPVIMYADFTGNISVRMTGVPPLVSVSSFDLLINSFSVPRHQIFPVAGSSR